MKPSRYNYIVEDGPKAIFFNGLTEQFFEVPLQKRDMYDEIISHPDSYAESFTSFLERMKSNGFIHDDGVNEDELLEQKFSILQGENAYHLMILPTYQCNLRCWYCIQDHQNMRMSKETVEEVRELIRNITSDPSIDVFRISWFGGEPLLEYDIVKSITEYSKKLCEQNEKIFSCDITTNGTLLNRERIGQLRDAGVTFYQITIDGTRQTHDTIKVLKKGSAFDKSLENMNIIAEHTPLFLRFNYTHENLQPDEIIRDVTERINPENRHNVKFFVYKVWQEDETKIDPARLERLTSMSVSEGITAQLPINNQCYADARNFNCIFPNGKVAKCDNEPPASAEGRMENGEIIWEGEHPVHVPAFRNHSFPCHKCSYVPVCWGPCVAKRRDLTEAGGKGRCQYNDMQKEMRQMILNRCKNSIFRKSAMKAEASV